MCVFIREVCVCAYIYTCISEDSCIVLIGVIITRVSSEDSLLRTKMVLFP